MSMARGEAIKAFEEIRENAQNNLGAKWAHGCDGYYRDKIELADVALSALRTPTREMVEKVFPGCVLCKWGGLDCVGVDGDGIYLSKPPKDEKFRFCPVCGKPLTDEAVEMVMERINEMEEITDEH